MIHAAMAGRTGLVAVALSLAAGAPALAGPDVCPGRTPVGPTGVTVAAPHAMPGNCSTGYGDGVVTLAGRPLSYTYDSYTATRTAYDEHGHLLSETYANGETATFTGVAPMTTVTDRLGHTMTFTYDAHHEVASVIDPQGHATTFTYDPSGRAADITDTQGRTSSYGYDAVGRVTSATDGMGVTTSYAYDPGGALTGSTNPGLTTSYAYDAVGNLTQVHDSLGNTVSYGYDGFGRVTSQTDAGAVNEAFTYTYDTAGDVLSQADSLSGMTQFTYDAQGNMLSEVDPFGHTTTETWSNGLLQSITDPMGHTTTYQYDARYRLVGETGPDGRGPSFAYLAQGIPEPGTWALLLVGFGGLGLALRRRGLRAAA